MIAKNHSTDLRLGLRATLPGSPFALEDEPVQPEIETRLRQALAAPCCRRSAIKSLSAALLGAALAGTGRRVPEHALAQRSSASGAGVVSGQALPAPSLLVYDTVQGLLAGDLQHSVSIDRVSRDLAAFPPGWVVAGVGTTNQPGRTGEIVLDGSVSDTRFWWADPSSSSQTSVSDLSAGSRPADLGFPFLAFGVAGGNSPLTWQLDNVPDVHAWLKDKLSAASIPLASVQIVGDFGPVATTVSYNIPPTGIDTNAAYLSPQNFRMASYESGKWRLDGVYAAAPALQPVISAAGSPLHVHGYQPGPSLGGHVISAACTGGIATVWLLNQLVEQPAPLAPEPAPAAGASVAQRRGARKSV